MLGGLKKLFGGDASPPEPPPAVRRRIFFRGLTQGDFVGLLEEFESLGIPGPAANLELFGPVDGWFAVELPEHWAAYTFHNLANWLLGTGGPAADAIIAWSLERVAGPDFGGNGDGGRGDKEARWRYYLVPESEFDDLIGYQADGTSLVVHVPDNQVFRGEKIALEPRGAEDYFQFVGVPTDLYARDIAQSPVLMVIHPEDPGDMNNRLEPSELTRAQARRSTGYLL